MRQIPPKRKNTQIGATTARQESFALHNTVDKTVGFSGYAPQTKPFISIASDT